MIVINMHGQHQISSIQIACEYSESSMTSKGEYEKE